MDPKTHALLDAEAMEAPASEEALQALAEFVRAAFGTRLPDDYRDFLRASDGYNGDVGGKDYVVFWSAALVQSYTEDYEAQRWMPGLLMIGSNGGNAVFGLDLRDPDTTAYVETDFVPMNWDHTFGRDASLYDFLLRRIAQHDDDGDDEEQAALQGHEAGCVTGT